MENDNSSIMEKCLMKIRRIRQCEKDESGYEIFLVSASVFLKSHTNNAIFINPILKGFKQSNNTKVLEVLYTLSSFLRVGTFFLDEKTIKSHFKIEELQPAILKCVNSFNLSYLDNEIRDRLVLDQNFTCPSLYTFIERRKEISKGFMFRTDASSTYKQLELILNCKLFYNLDYFVKFLGSQSKILALKAFEAFSIIFQELELTYSTDPRSIETITLPNCIILDSRLSKPRLCLNLKNTPLDIEDSINFLQFSFEFLEERENIIQLVEQCETNNEIARDSLNGILNKYAESKLLLNMEEVCTLKLCYRKHIPEEQEEAMDIQDFNFLFDKTSRKDICDCYEF